MKPILVKNKGRGVPRYTYTDEHGTTIQTDDRPRMPADETRWGGHALAVTVIVVLTGFASLVGYVVVVYGIQGKPTAHERERQTIANQGQQIQRLQQRVDSLTLRLDELEGR